ncbi:hypothetical protein B5S28_g2417 [[Candida] boidinii]|nr:hypothetical protein B5S28_g2417 [[Candida] boidinii]OWB71878.1 hypothetical protein B5S31_g1574 [[Candida] boidinii]OWB77642.1 hypothetical protein B5S32_g1816 [[Candida] boidinii]
MRYRAHLFTAAARNITVSYKLRRTISDHAFAIINKEDVGKRYFSSSLQRRDYYKESREDEGDPTDSTSIAGKRRLEELLIQANQHPDLMEALTKFFYSSYFAAMDTVKKGTTNRFLATLSVMTNQKVYKDAWKISSLLSEYDFDITLDDMKLIIDYSKRRTKI